MKNFLRLIAIGIFAAILGHLCAGCGGTDTGTTAQLDPWTMTPTELATEAAAEAKVVALQAPCSIPSPTGDVVDPYTGQTARESVAIAFANHTGDAYATVANVDEILAICEHTATDPACSPATANSCPPIDTPAECADAAHDYESSTGIAFGFDITNLTNPKSATYNQWDVYRIIEAASGFARGIALCSPTGVFVGWSQGIIPSN